MILLAVIVCFGPVAAIMPYDEPLPSRMKDILVMWYIVGGIMLVMSFIGCASPKAGYRPSPRQVESKQEVS